MAGAAADGRGDAAAALRETYEVSVESPEFKFCSAHFTAYPGFREKLHGHNYTVSVQLAGRLNSDGYVLDFGDLKRVLREECKSLHEHVLLPKQSDVVKFLETGQQLSVTCEDGSSFSFPAGDCLLLPLAHTTAEEFASYFWGRLAERLTLAQLHARGVESMKVAVWEGPLQSAAFSRALPLELPPPKGAASPAAPVEAVGAEAAGVAAEPPAKRAAPRARPLPRAVLVTGAARGYGAALAAALAREAASSGRRLQLTLTARDKAALRETATVCGREGAEGVRCCSLDLSQLGKLREALKAPLQAMAEDVQKLEETSSAGVEVLLVHNAGSLGPLSYCQDIPDQDAQLALDVNVTSFTVLTNTFLLKFTSQGMAEKRLRIRIVNISSLLAVEAFPAFSLYAIGKAARDMAMRCIAKEGQAQGRDVRTLSWAPGPMPTAMTDTIMSSCADVGIVEMFKSMDKEGNFVAVDASAEKLMKLLAEDTYESGAHIDYYDV